MLSPLAIARGLVVDSGEELEFIQGHLLGLDAQLVVQLALRGALHTQDCSVQFRPSLARDAQGVRAAGVGPHVGEGDFLGGTLLKQQALVGIEQEDGEGTVEKALINVCH